MNLAVVLQNQSEEEDLSGKRTTPVPGNPLEKSRMRKWLVRRYLPLHLSWVCSLLLLGLPHLSPWLHGLGFGCFLLFLLGLLDLWQPHHAVRRNYPILGNLRFILEYIRPEIRQYFVEDDITPTPFSRTMRAIVYQRAKHQTDKRPFGTRMDVYAAGYEWLNHAMVPGKPESADFRILVGPRRKQPVSLSLLNISAMSFGALSGNAIQALNLGAKLGNFAHDTGEGSVSTHHVVHGGNLIWNIGSGYFGCRTPEGTFSLERFSEVAQQPQIKMIEIKLSQGAKPGHGGVLPAGKVTPEIAQTRRVPLGQDCISPAAHTAFSTPIELLQWLEMLSEHAGGKPVGIKLCLGHPWEWFALAKAMHNTGITPDFIVIDGAEGGTGAAPLEFTDHVGMPLQEGLHLVHNTLRGLGLRQQIRLGASGKIISAFDLLRTLAMGADWCNAARGFMFALGCIQAQNCHTGHCPTGITTQDPLRQRALVVTDRAARVRNYHQHTLQALMELTAATGLDNPARIDKHHLMRRMSSGTVVSLAHILTDLPENILLQSAQNNCGDLPEPYRSYWLSAQPTQWTV